MWRWGGGNRAWKPQQLTNSKISKFHISLENDWKLKCRVHITPSDDTCWNVESRETLWEVLTNRISKNPIQTNCRPGPITRHVMGAHNEQHDAVRRSVSSEGKTRIFRSFLCRKRNFIAVPKRYTWRTYVPHTTTYTRVNYETERPSAARFRRRHKRPARARVRSVWPRRVCPHTMHAPRRYSDVSTNKIRVDRFSSFFDHTINRKTCVKI